MIDCGDDFKNMKRVTVCPVDEKDCESASDFILEKLRRTETALL